MEKIYHVDLTPKQRKLKKIVCVGSNKAKVITRVKRTKKLPRCYILVKKLYAEHGSVFGMTVWKWR
jgi:hypothetical protein